VGLGEALVFDPVPLVIRTVLRHDGQQVKLVFRLRGQRREHVVLSEPPK